MENSRKLRQLRRGAVVAIMWSEYGGAADCYANTKFPPKYGAVILRSFFGKQKTQTLCGMFMSESVT